MPKIDRPFQDFSTFGQLTLDMGVFIYLVHASMGIGKSIFVAPDLLPLFWGFGDVDALKKNEMAKTLNNGLNMSEMDPLTTNSLISRFSRDWHYKRRGADRFFFIPHWLQFATFTRHLAWVSMG